MTYRNLINKLQKPLPLLVLTLLLAGLVWFAFFALPEPLFSRPTSTVLLSRQGELLSARIAEDGQWRFPAQIGAAEKEEQVPEKFRQALLHFEDRDFYRHPGVNPVAIVRALKQNLEAGRVVSGGSTITMQVIRLSRQGQPRTVWEKLKESVLALRLELRYSKEEILALYAANAPFGGNVVGLKTAAWRYFGRSPQQLSWGEAAALAVLPNAPALIFPGRNEEALRDKRNRLVKSLWKANIIDSLTYVLAAEEPLPGQPLPLPRHTPHLLDRLSAEGKAGKLVVSTIDLTLQQQVNDILSRHHALLSLNEIHNAAALVLDVETNEVLAYAGNVPNAGAQHGQAVDIITAPRSTGSILKPFLFSAMLTEGELLPQMLIPDIPTQISGYTPQNFDEQYAGAVAADEALAQSLNIPAVRLLQDYGVEKLHYKLRQLGLTTLTYSPSHYGLSLILGGAEGSLWDIASAYAGMARTLNLASSRSYEYAPSDFAQPDFVLDKDPIPAETFTPSGPLSAAGIWHTFEALREVNRPREEAGWELLGTSFNVAWKTGTSFGFRDAWAVGVTPRHVVAVWVGNADGEGRPGLTGVTAAAPVLFDLFRLLPTQEWFPQPYDEQLQVPICCQSGHRASPVCEPVDTIFIPRTGSRTAPCPYHRLVHLDAQVQRQVTSRCLPVSQMVHQPWFVLPPVQEHYYRQRHPQYRPLPPYAPGCEASGSVPLMQVIYPHDLSRIFVPVELDGQQGRTVFQVAHREADVTIHWHVDDEYLGTTQAQHELALAPSPGLHTLTLVDAHGETVVQQFEVVGRRR